MNKWRKDFEEGVEISAPYDAEKVFRLRSVTMSYVLDNGKLPDRLSSFLESDLGGADEAIEGLSGKEMLDMQEQYDRALIEAVLVSPKIVDKPKADDEITWGMLNPQDRQFILWTIDKPISAWRRFPIESGAGVESVSAGEGE